MKPGPGAGQEGDIRLVCDGTLGALCRWLRAAGYDTEFISPRRRARRDAPAQTEQLLEMARTQGRMVLTRSQRIQAELGERAVLVRDDVPFHQVLEVAGRLNLSLTERALTRCREDNAVLHSATPGEVVGRVPQYVARTQSRFVACPRCGRVYWAATHRDSMLERLGEMERIRLGQAPLPSWTPPTDEGVTSSG
ncbi:MAG: Mut7-C RNAse domain-containing protein [Myxococcota bacterium]